MSLQTYFIGRRFILLFLLALAPSILALAQQYTIEGLITNAQTGEPLELSNVVLLYENGDIYKGTTADINGLYQIGSISKGRYIMKVSYVGYTTYVDSVAFLSGALNKRKSVRLNPSDESQDEGIVTYSGRTADLSAGQKKISRIELARVPTPAGGGDIASYLQTLPGVVSTGDRGGQLFVRGGTPSENMVLVDGMLIYQPFHIIGFFSAFPQELVANADFYAGGFSSRYIGRTSSVLDVKLRQGNKYEYSGSGSISPFLGEVFVEGPLVKGRSSIVLSTRRSLIEGASKFYPSGEQPLRFDSQFLKMSYNNNAGGNCSTLLMRTYDRGRLDYEEGDAFKWNNLLVGGRCSGLSDGPISLFDINVGFSYVSNVAGADDKSTGSIFNGVDKTTGSRRESNASLFNLDINLTQFAKKIRFDYGVFLKVNALDYDINEMFFNQEADENTIYSLGGYVESTIPFGEKIDVYPGVAIDVSNNYDASIEPRLRVSWQPRNINNEEINAALGIYRQPLIGITDDRDAGSAFTAWMPVPGEASQMEAIHALLGWRQPFGDKLNLSVEGYYKWLKNKPVAVWGTVAQFSTEIASADGFIYGTDVSLEYNGRVLYTSLGYGYSWTEYETSQDLFITWFGESSQSYHPAHDRRHKVNVQTSLNFGKYMFNLGWQLGSGLPYTRPLGFDDLIRFEDKLPNIKGDPGVPRIIMDRPYGGRMPVYHRLDASMERDFEFTGGLLNVQLGAINTYNQANIFYFDVYTQRRINQLPFYPYASLKLEVNK